MKKEELDPIEFEDQKAPPRQIAGFDLLVSVRLLAAAACLIAGLFFPADSIVRLVFMLACFLVAGYDVVTDAVFTLVHRHTVDENFLLTLACMVAFIIRADAEGAAIMLIFRLGRFLLAYVVDRTRRSVRTSTNPCPTQATLMLDEQQSTVDVSAIKPGDTLVLRPGDAAPVDCLVTDGYSSLDTSALTGDHQLRSVEEGGTILAGSVNVSSLIQAEAINAADGSTMERICRILDDPEADKSRWEALLSRYDHLYAPIAIAVCAVYAVLLSLLSTLPVVSAIHRALVLLVIFCPAGLLAGMALTYFAGIHGAAQEGILFKSPAVMDSLTKVNAVIFDKNGVITTGDYKVDSIKTGRIDAETLLKVAAHALANASSPMAGSIVAAYGGAIDYSIIGDFQEYPDGSASVTINSIPVLIGTRSFLDGNHIAVAGADDPDTLAVHLALGGRYAGSILLSDMVRENAMEAVSSLETLGCADIIMLAEDSAAKTKGIAQSAGIGKYYSQCLPIDKLSRIQETCSRVNGSVVFVGSASADTAAFEAASAGFLLGGLGSEETVAVADVIAMDEDPEKVAAGITNARQTNGVLRQGVLLVLGVKLVILLLFLSGICSQVWFAVFADAAAGLACSLNAVRAFLKKRG